jgi:hypothetical protein
MMVHVLSGQWPFPGEAVRVNPRNPNNPNDVVGVTEFDRREEYINLIGNEHPLMTLIQGCLSNSPSHRPTSSEVHQRVSAVAADHPPSFTNRVEMMDRINTLGQEKKGVLVEKDATVAEKNREIAEIRTEKDAVTREKEMILSELEEAQSTIGSLRDSHSIEVEALQIEITDIKADNEHLHAIIAAKQKECKSDKEEIKQRYEKQLETMKKEKHAMKEQHLAVKYSIEQQYQAQLESKVSELSAKDALISRKSGTIQSLQMKLGQALGSASNKDNLSVFSPGVKLIVAEYVNVPGIVSFLDQGLTIGGGVYVGVTKDREIFKYSITEDSWSALLVAPVYHARLGYLNMKVLIVGGRISSSQVTADIHEFDEASQQWVRSTSIPPMPTARSSATVVSWSSPPALIVCGGNDQQGQPMTVVEVYYGRTSQWHAVTPLPFPRARMTHTVIHNMLYLVGGYETREVASYKKMVLSTLIPQLVETGLQSSPTSWKSLSISNIPNYRPTAASLGGCLLVVGGMKDVTHWPPKPKSVVSSVHAYCPSTSSWVLVGQIPQPLFDCTTAALPTGELLVIGGGISSGRATNTTYKCSLSSSIV